MDLKNKIKLVQIALGVTADGIIGEQTINAILKKLNLIEDNSNQSTNMKSITISIGHSEQDKGAYSSGNEISEYDYNKELATLVKDELYKSNINAIIVNRLTDGGGTGMQADIKAVNANKAECIIELHNNAYNGKASGTETLYWHSSKNGKYLAECIQNELVKSLSLPNRGIKPANKDDRGGAVLLGSKYTMVIIEPFFIDNKDDLTIGLAKKKDIAIAISKGLIKYLYTV